VSDLTSYHSLRFALYSGTRHAGKHENDLIERVVGEGYAWELASTAIKLGHTLPGKPPGSGEEEETLRPAMNALQNKGENHDLPAATNRKLRIGSGQIGSHLLILELILEKNE
jgi:hypothetical protein